MDPIAESMPSSKISDELEFQDRRSTMLTADLQKQQSSRLRDCVIVNVPDVSQIERNLLGSHSPAPLESDALITDSFFADQQYNRLQEEIQLANHESSDLEQTTPSRLNPVAALAGNRITSAISQLSDAILERFPLASPAVLLFVGNENNRQTDSTCEQVSRDLASRNVGDILLIDSNYLGQLSLQQGRSKARGLNDLASGQQQWQQLICKSSTAGLDFIPSGTSRPQGWGSEEHLRLATAEMKQHYQFICVTTGDAHDEMSNLWSSVCDGSYLLVSLTQSNETVAQSAVAELQSSGARLLGCVVTEV